MRYEIPTIVDYGSIAEHTFTNANPRGPVTCSPGNANPGKDTMVCKYDCFGEWSCSSTGLSP